LEDAGIDGRIILKWISLRLDGRGGIDWFDLAQDRNRRLALVNAVINLRVPKMQGISWVAEYVSASQEGLCSKKLVGYSTNSIISKVSGNAHFSFQINSNSTCFF
jgi:hypothetical protein